MKYITCFFAALFVALIFALTQAQPITPAAQVATTPEATSAPQTGEMARPTATPQGVRYCAAASMLTVYEHPERGAKAAGWLQPGERVSIISTAGAFRLITNGTLTGFVSSSYCKMVQ